MRNSDAVIEWDRLAERAGDHFERVPMYLDTRWLNDAEQDEFFLLLTGYMTHREIMPFPGAKQATVLADGIVLPEDYTTSHTAEHGIAKFLPRFKDAIPDELRKALEELGGSKRVTFHDRRQPVQKADGSWRWLIDGTLYHISEAG